MNTSAQQPTHVPRNMIELNAREMAIAQLAAEIAVKKMTEDFYSQVGRTVIQKFVIVIGAMAFAAWAYAKGKGWV